MRVWKLISSKGTLLGNITVPPHIEDMLLMQRLSGGGVHFHFVEPHAFESYAKINPPTSLLVKTALLGRAWSWPTDDGLSLFGITIEEFETIPGCSFSPSAAYLRSLHDAG